MRRLSVLLLALVSAGCSALPFLDEENADDFRVPLVCLPKHTQLPCSRRVEQGVGYRFNLQTHWGIEWAYFDGRYWVPKAKVKTPSQWANITAGTMVLEPPGRAAPTRADFLAPRGREGLTPSRYQDPRAYPMAPVTLKFLLTKTWCGQLILIMWTAYEPSLSFSTRLTVPPGYLASARIWPRSPPLR
jgi:hypothetical protein